MRAYQDLWAELGERRRSAPELAPPTWQARNPRLTYPFDVFAGHAGGALADDVPVRLDPEAPDLDALTAMPCNVFAENAMLSRHETETLLRAVREGGRTLSQCIAVLPVGRRVRAERSVAWLAKYGVLIVGGRDPGVGT